MSEEDNIETDSITLTKTSKGYSWKLKVFDNRQAIDMIKRLETLDKILRKKWGKKK